jgi:serine/threonine protein kinase
MMQIYDEQHSLPEGTVLGYYQVLNVLGEGGFGITYFAVDRQSGMRVVIKEYFPNAFAVRLNDSRITAKTSEKTAFKKGLQRFKEEAQILARFNHPSIVKILGYFEENNTAYIVMEYEEGIDLAQYLKQHPSPLPQEEVLGIMMPILEGLKEVHRHYYLHRDIKPANILVRQNKLPVLIDFGASKQALGDVSKSITSMLTEGYAPLEQYSTDVKQQGPFTDLYAVAAVMYRMITGTVPPSAQTRSYELLQEGNDPLLLLGEYGLQGYDGNFLYAIDRALALKGKDRPQSVQEFQYLLMGMERSEIEERIRQNVSEDTYVPQIEEVSSDSISLSGFFSFDGVIHRLDYLLHSFFALLFLIAGIVVIVSTRNHYTEEPSEIGVLGLILFLIFSFWGGIAALVKRTRDIGQSIPLFIFLSMVPYVNVIIGLILLFTPSKFSEKI